MLPRGKSIKRVLVLKGLLSELVKVLRGVFSIFSRVVICPLRNYLSTSLFTSNKGVFKDGARLAHVVKGEAFFRLNTNRRIRRSLR